MNTEERNAIKKISRHRELNENIPIYGNAYVNAVYEYSMIRLALNYYTLKEVFDESGGLTEDDELADSLNDIHTIIFEVLLNSGSDERSADIENERENISKIDSIRKNVTRRMRVLTSYTDALQIYEYVLNRVEFSITGEKYDVDPDDLSNKLFRYLFSENDKMVINSKIQMVTAQLPVRMTKNRFFDYLSDTLNIYNGSDVKSFDDFCEMIRSTALLEKPEGYGDIYPEIYKMIEQLENTDFRKLDDVTYRALMEQFAMTTAHLTDTVSNHLLTMEVVNALYSILLAIPYAGIEKESVEACVSMIRCLHSSYISEDSIPDEADEYLQKIEGVQETLTEDIMQFESVLPDILKESEDEIDWIMADKIFGSLSIISKLLSDSLFIEIDDKEFVEDMTDNAYIAEKRDELVGLFTEFFSSHSKEVNRAVMGAVFSNMPVLFNSMQETKEYIEHSLSHCGNESELMACGKILDEMMNDEL